SARADALVFGGDQEPREAWMERDPGQLSAEARDAAVLVRPEAREERERGLERRRRRWLQVREGGGVKAEREQREARVGQVLPRDRGEIALRHRRVIVLRIEPHAATRGRAPGAAGALLGRRLADGRGEELGQTRPGGVPRPPREAAVDDDAHARDRER